MALFQGRPCTAGSAPPDEPNVILVPETRRYLALDLGASHGRAILGAFDGGQMQMREVHRFPTPIIELGPRLYWDLDAVWASMQEALQRLTEEHVTIRSLSVDSWGVDYVPLDAALRPLRRAISYRDPRTSAMVEKAARRVSDADQYRVTGTQPLPYNTLYQVLADQAHTPKLHASAACHLPIADYFNFRFSGKARVDASMASTTQLFDPEKRIWAGNLMQAYGLDPGSWPAVVASGTVLGPLLWDDGVQVVAGCSHDTACAVAAVPAEPGGRRWAFLSSGTWSIVGMELAHPVRTESARLAGVANEVGFAGTIRLLKNVTGLWLLQECQRAWRESGINVGYDRLLEEARAARPAEACVDVQDAHFLKRADMPSMLRSYCMEHGIAVPETRGSLVRLVLQSLAEKYRQVLEELEDLLEGPVEVLHVVGGGSRNALLNQWTADCCGRTVVAGPAEATALGNLLIQARALGDIPDDASLRDVARRSTDLEVFSPQAG